jgi:hypothetical protein
MKARLYERRAEAKGTIAFSLAAHVVAIMLIASITFRYPISALFRDNTPQAKTERIQYVQVRPPASAPAGNASTERRAPRRPAARPAPVFAPITIPSALPPIPAPTASVREISGTGTGGGGSGGAPGIATGVAPALPDSRIELRPNALRLPLSTAQRNDSAVKAIYMAYREAEVLAEEHRGRDPRDWTFERNGQKYGVDTSWIYLGKFKIPSAILAALPFNYGGVDGNRIIQARNAAWIQNDIYTHSQGLSEDDFRAAVRRFRERKERERREAEAKEKGTKPTIVP